MIEIKDLTLTVEKQVAGELVTNALAIKAFVEDRIQEFSPEKYYDDPDAAKRDRAVLNAAAKELNTRRLALEREFNRPFEEFKSIIKQTTTTLERGAEGLDEIVQAVEETIKSEKMEKIQTIFESKKFTLAPLTQIFDQKWLNKGSSLKAIEEEITARIQRTYADIVTIESLPFDVAEVKANYLDTLDIGQALATANRLKANRERAEAEKKSREDRVHTEHIESQRKELRIDARKEREDEKTDDVVSQALEEPKDPISEITLRFKGTRAQLISLRQYMTEHGIEYTKVEA